MPVYPGAFSDPIFPDFQDHALSVLDGYLGKVGKYLDTFFTDKLAYIYPGPIPGWRQWDFWSYAYGACPFAQARFEEVTGMKFDPRFFVAEDQFINRPPNAGYLAWMKFKQDIVNRWAKRVMDVCHAHDVRFWFYWGDYHIGVEPYLGALDVAGINDIDISEGQNAVKIRCGTDFSSKAKTGMRITWLRTKNLSKDNADVGLWRVWRRTKKGLLFKMMDRIYWMPFQVACTLPDEVQREKVLTAIKGINDEFRFLHTQLKGKQVFKHDLNLYIVNAWGQVYSWRPWGGDGGIILSHLADLPIRVKWISLSEIAEHGVPKDAHVLLNYGKPGTAWSGDYFWGLKGLPEKIKAFVEQGGGLIGIEAPSHYPNDDKTWQLTDVLGVEYAGEAQGCRMTRTGAGGTHWVTRSLPDHLGPLSAHVAGKVLADDLKVLYSGGSAKDASQLVGVRSCGKGRAAYLSGQNASPAYYQLLKRLIFWSAGKEDLLHKLHSETNGVFVYLYPQTRTLVVYNTNNRATPAIVHLDTSLLGKHPGTEYQLFNVAAEKSAGKATANELARGVTLSMQPHESRFLQIRPAK